MNESEQEQRIRRFEKIVASAPKKGIAILCEQDLDALEIAYNRYTHLIDISGSDLSEEEIAKQRERYSHLLYEPKDGLPVFCDQAAVEYMSLVTGIPVEHCAVYVYTEWVDIVASGFIDGEDPETFIEQCYQELIQKYFL